MPEGGRPRLKIVLRSLHRDVGCVAVGLTIVYALSGLAVNHIGSFDPNFKRTVDTFELGPLSGDDAEIVRTVLQRLDITAPPTDVYRAGPTRLDITLQARVLRVNPTTGHVDDDAQRPRFLLRAMNWLHLNRGKKAWTVFADGYAIALLFLAGSGLFLLPSTRRIFGRGGLLILAGIAIPLGYVLLSGGP